MDRFLQEVTDEAHASGGSSRRAPRHFSQESGALLFRNPTIAPNDRFFSAFLVTQDVAIVRIW
jgi:hypothetical protein